MPVVMTQEWVWADLWDCLFRFSVPIFFMISGALFLQREIPIKRIWTKYIFHLVMVFFFWSILFDILARKEYTFLEMISWAFVGMSRFTFLLQMISIYAICPFIKIIVEGKKLRNYYVIINIIYIIVMQFFGNYDKYISSLNVIKFIEDIKSWVERIPVLFLSHILLYFVLGYILDKEDISKKYRRIIYFFGGLSTALTILMTCVDSQRAKVGVFDWQSSVSINVMVQSVAVFIAIKNISINVNEKSRVIIKKISSLTLGIYVVHSLILDYFLPNILKLDVYMLPPIIAVPCIALMVFMICLIIVLILKKILIIRYFI